MNNFYYLTKGGNIMVLTDTESFFMTPSFKFLRLVGRDEKDYLVGKSPQFFFKKEPRLPETSIWNFLWATEKKDVDGDEKEYKKVNFYFRENNGKKEFLKVEEISFYELEKENNHNVNWIGLEDQEYSSWKKDYTIDEIGHPVKAKEVYESQNWDSSGYLENSQEEIEKRDVTFKEIFKTDNFKIFFFRRR